MFNTALSKGIIIIHLLEYFNWYPNKQIFNQVILPQKIQSVWICFCTYFDYLKPSVPMHVQKRNLKQAMFNKEIKRQTGITIHHQIFVY